MSQVLHRTLFHIILTKTTDVQRGSEKKPRMCKSAGRLMDETQFHLHRKLIYATYWTFEREGGPVSDRLILVESPPAGH